MPQVHRRTGPAAGLLVLLLWICATAGPALADNILLDVTYGLAQGSARLAWSGEAPPYNIYAASTPSSVVGQSNLLATTSDMEWTDGQPASPIIYYIVTQAVVQVCGNSMRETGEHCDDGNTTNLDGCDAACQFEQAQRAIWFKMQFAPDTVCNQNALGVAFVGGPIRNEMQTFIDTAVSDGSFSLVMPSLGAADLSGTNEPDFDLGFVRARPETRGGTLSYNGISDLDWWHNVDPLSLTPSRQPLYLLPAAINAASLVAGPGAVVLPSIFPSSGPPLYMSQTRLTIFTGASSTPLASAAGDPPGHLASENLDPALTSYATCGTPTAGGSGRLCGNVRADELAQTLIPAQMVGCGLFNCTLCYTATNTMLDVLVGGCTINIVGQQIRATQPDATDPAAPVAGAGPPYTLVADASRHITTCRDRLNAIVDLSTCLNSAAYSSFFRLATDRVIPK